MISQSTKDHRTPLFGLIVFNNVINDLEEYIDYTEG